MKNKSKKLLALLVSGLMAVSSLTLSCSSAFAESNISNSKLETDVSSSPVAVTGSIGSHIADEMKKSEEEKADGQQSYYAINKIEYDAEYGIIDVDYISKTNSTIFVGFYNDEGNELYSSITRNVQASDNGHEQLIVLDALPEHYLIKVFLIGNHQNALCKAFVYEKCTKVMQEILSKTTDDFKENEVINLDKSDEKNFIVLADGVKHIKADSKNDVYEETNDGKLHFNNIKEIAKLKKDSVVVVEVPDDLLSFKVKDINITDSSAVITPYNEDDVPTEELFQFVNIDSEETTSPTSSQSSTHKDDGTDENEVTKKYNEALHFSNLFTFYFQEIPGEKEGLLISDPDVATTKIAATLTLGFSGKIEFYFSLDLGETFIDADINASASLNVLGQLKFEKSLPSVAIPFGAIPKKIVGVVITATPCLAINGKLSATVSSSLHYDLYNGLTIADEPYRKLDISATIDFGITFAIGIALVGSRADITLKPKIGIRATVSNTKSEKEKPKYLHHDCSNCKDVNCCWYINASASASVKLIKEHKIEMKKAEVQLPFVLTINENGISEGKCKNYSYLMNYSVTDQNGDPIKDVEITSDKNNLVDSKGKAISKVKTDDKGYAELWININDLFDETTTLTCAAPTGETDVFCIYSYYASADGKRAMDCKRTIKLKAVEDKKDKEKNTSNNSGGGNIIESGIWGDPKKYPEVSNVHYELTSDGDLYFWGEGLIKDGQLKKENRGSVKRIIVLSDKLKWDSTLGYDKEAPGNYTLYEHPVYVDISRCSNEYLGHFIGVNNLEEVILPHNLKHLIIRNFEGATKLKKVILPDSLEKIGLEAEKPAMITEVVFARCTSLEEIELPDSVTFLGTDTFYMDKNLKRVRMSSNLEVIGYRAFADSGITSITIPESVKTIHPNAFDDDYAHGHTRNCSSLKSVIIEGDYEGDNIFRNQPSIERVAFGKKVTKINYGTFDHDDIKEVTIPANVMEIGQYAFTDNDNLKKITILNPNCKIKIENGFVNEKATIYCYTDSTAHKYALKHGNPYVLLDSQNATTVSGNAGTTIKTTTTTTSSTTTTTAPVTTVFTYTNAVPDSEYVLIAVKDASAIKPVTIEGKEDDIKLAAANQLSLLSTDNIIYFDQQTADEKGTVTFSFVKNKDATYILTGDFGSHKVDQMVSKGEPKVEDAPQKYVYESEVPMVETKTEVVMGDANGNGKVDMSDAVLIMQMLSNPSKFKISPELMENADVYKPGTGITTMDALSIQKYLLSLIPKLPEY